MLDSIKAFSYLAFVEAPEITGEITCDPSETLNFRIAAAGTVDFDLSLITAL